MLTWDLLDRLIDECDLSGYRQKILELPQPSIRLYSEPVQNESELRIGASKLGGLPDLPAGTGYPQYNRHGLSFVAQINLADIQDFRPHPVLPSSGLLYFFYMDILPGEGKGSSLWRWSVIYSDASLQSLQRREAPENLCDGPYRPCALRLGQDLTIPEDMNHFSYKVTGWTYNPERLNPNPLMENLWRLQEKLDDPDDPRINRMLGYPDSLQNDAFWEADYIMHFGDQEMQGAARYNAFTDYDDWTLLLQVDSDDNAGMMWGDVGLLYYCIRNDDLAARRFDRVQCVMQCC